MRLTAIRRATLRVSEMFASVQGEGPHAGRPSVFLRLGLCNLSCSWCDTPYTWLFDEERLEKVRASVPEPSEVGRMLPRKPFDKTDELTKREAPDVLHMVKDLAGTGVRAVVITGGEPLLHKKPLMLVVPSLLSAGFQIEFETNGTISPAGLPSTVHLNVSPKLSNSHQPRSIRLNFSVLTECLNHPSSVLKFVVDDREDLDEILEIVHELQIPPSRVYLMPQGTVGSLAFFYSLWSERAIAPLAIRLTLSIFSLSISPFSTDRILAISRSKGDG